MQLRPQGNSTEVILSGWDDTGDIRIWAPECVMSNTGCSAVYPSGRPWRAEGKAVVQEVEE